MKEKYDKKQRFLLPVRRNMTAAPAETVYVPPAMNRNSVTVAGPVKISPGKKNPALLMREPTATEHTHTKRRTSSGMMSVLFLLSLESSSKFLFPEIHPVLQGMIMPVSAGSP